MFQILDLLFLSCFFLAVEPQRDQVLPPQNVTLVWINALKFKLSWEPPQHSMENCTYIGTSEIATLHSLELTTIKPPLTTWSKFRAMEGGQMNLTLYTVCNGKESEKVVRQVSQPELIKNLQCYVYADKKANCSWLPASPALDLKFYYLLSSWDSSRSVDECFSYKDTDGIRTGCHLDVSFQDNIFIIFNGTLNNTPAWNTFSRYLNDDVRPPPLIWTVTKSDGKLNISWTPLNIHGLHWKYIINYHECDELKTKTTDGPVTSAVVDVVPHCPYRICVKAKSDGGETPCDKEKLFDADADPAAWVYAAIIIPLLFACLAVLIIVCCRKNKEVIFPKIPEPRNLLSDISDNNNKITVRNLYIPAEEEENCKITLVHEP